MSGNAQRASWRRRPWPPVEGERGVEAVRWQVWIGSQLREWRRQAPFGGRRGLTQGYAARRVGLRQDALSRLESGFRRVDAFELLVLAHAYARTPADLGLLFTPPTRERWAAICEGRTIAAEFTNPPAGVYRTRPGRPHPPG